MLSKINLILDIIEKLIKYKFIVDMERKIMTLHSKKEEISLDINYWTMKRTIQSHILYLVLYYSIYFISITLFRVVSDDWKMFQLVFVFSFLVIAWMIQEWVVSRLQYYPIYKKQYLFSRVIVFILSIILELNVFLIFLSIRGVLDFKKLFLVTCLLFFSPLMLYAIEYIIYLRVKRKSNIFKCNELKIIFKPESIIEKESRDLVGNPNVMFDKVSLVELNLNKINDNMQEMFCVEPNNWFRVVKFYHDEKGYLIRRECFYFNKSQVISIVCDNVSIFKSKV